MAFVVLAAEFGASGHFAGPWVSLAAGSLATAIPGAPGRFGAFHYFAARGLSAREAPMGAAIAFALTVHALLWISLTVTGAGLLPVARRAIFSQFSNRLSRSSAIRGARGETKIRSIGSAGRRPRLAAPP